MYGVPDVSVVSLTQPSRHDAAAMGLNRSSLPVVADIDTGVASINVLYASSSNERRGAAHRDGDKSSPRSTILIAGGRQYMFRTRSSLPRSRRRWCSRRRS